MINYNDIQPMATTQESEFCCGFIQPLDAKPSQTFAGAIQPVSQPTDAQIEDQTLKMLYEKRYKDESKLSYNAWLSSASGKAVRKEVQKTIKKENTQAKFKDFLKSDKAKNTGLFIAGLATGIAQSTMQNGEYTDDDSYEEPKKAKKILGMSPVTAAIAGIFTLLAIGATIFVITRKGRRAKS